MDISGLDGYTDLLTSQIRQDQAKQNYDKVKSALTRASARSAAGKAEDPELMDACKKFEAYFLEQVLKEMQKTVPKHDYGDSSTNQLVDFFKEGTMQDMAQKVADGEELGLARQLYEQMSRNIAPLTLSDVEAAEAAGSAAVAPEEITN